MKSSTRAENIPFAPDQGNTCVGSIFRSSRALRAVALAALAHTTMAWEDTCKPFREIYADGEDLCNTMFGDAFVYETDESQAYTMWFFGENPNKATAAALGFAAPTTCGLQYSHKEAPTAEGDSFTECHPWKDEACCKNSTVASAEALRLMYGPGYEWDRCGPMTPECARFFVQEACMYECDVTAGLYRKCSDAEVAAAGSDASDPCFENTWEMYKMPIKAGYCDAWFSACRNDRFCGSKNYFECDAYYWENKEAEDAAEAVRIAEAELALKNSELALKSSVSTGATVGIVIAVVVLLGGALGYVIRREKRGDPIFASLVAPDEPAPVSE